MISDIISVAGLFFNVASGLKTGKHLEKLLKTQENTLSEIKKLTDHIYYASGVQTVTDTNQNIQRTITDLRKIRQILEPVQSTLNTNIISSDCIATPERMQQLMQRNPWQVLIDVRPVMYMQPHVDPDMAPILFELDGQHYIGWQKRDLLPHLFNCEYDEKRWWPNPVQGLVDNPRQPAALFPASRKEKWGYINTHGDFVIEPDFDYTCYFSEGLACVQYDGKFGFIDENGHIVIEPQFDYLPKYFSEGLAFVRSPQNYKWGFIDKTGRFVIEPCFDDNPLRLSWDIQRFSQGWASVELGGKFGYIDKTGTFVIEPQFERAENFVGDLACVLKPGEYGVAYINMNMETVIHSMYPLLPDPFKEGMARTQRSGKYGFIDQTGRVVIEPRFDSCSSDFSEGLASVGLDDRYGYINKKGVFVIEPEYERAGDFCDGLASIQVDGKTGFIKKTGDIVIEPEYDPTEEDQEILWNFYMGLGIISLNDVVGYINAQGNIVHWQSADNCAQIFYRPFVDTSL